MDLDDNVPSGKNKKVLDYLTSQIQKMDYGPKKNLKAKALMDLFGGISAVITESTEVTYGSTANLLKEKQSQKVLDGKDKKVFDYLLSKIRKIPNDPKRIIKAKALMILLGEI